MSGQLIFQLGTNNWQREGEFAPGSGILHEAHHAAYNAMQDAVAYSVYPSTTQTSTDPLVNVLKLNHEIPICESISPVSSYRFHSMSQQSFAAYCDKVMLFAEENINAAEEAEGQYVSIAIAHHSFLNPLVLSRINTRRISAGKPRFKILCFVHGTALKMFAHEKAGVHPEYPLRFLQLMEKEGIFNGKGKIDACAAISNEQLQKFSEVFPNYPSDRMLLSPNGYNTNVFKMDVDVYANRQNVLKSLKLAESPIASAPTSITSEPDKVVVFCGKFADWKRLDALLHAAKQYEQEANIATLIIGSGPDQDVEHYHSLAYEQLGLKNTWFLGPLAHGEIARCNALADLGVYPSRNEPFGLVFIECMACGTPVIGADSGGPRDFVTNEVGGLVSESEGEELVGSLLAKIKQALDEDWKVSKGPVAANYVYHQFSVAKQCEDLLNGLDRVSLADVVHIKPGYKQDAAPQRI